MLKINDCLILEKVTSGKMCSKPTARKMPPLNVLMTESNLGLCWHFLLQSKGKEATRRGERRQEGDLRSRSKGC